MLDFTKGVALAAGGSVDLTKEAGGDLATIRIGLGWDPRRNGSEPFDLDASVIGLDADGRCAGEEWFVYFKRLQSPGGAIVHQGDELTGETEGDDEQIVVDLTKLPDTIHELAVAITIHLAAERNQNFGLVDNAYVRVVNEANAEQLTYFNLSEDAGGSTAVVVGKVYRNGGAWKFKALGEHYTTGMPGIVDAYKIS